MLRAAFLGLFVAALPHAALAGGLFAGAPMVYTTSAEIGSPGAQGWDTSHAGSALPSMTGWVRQFQENWANCAGCSCIVDENQSPNAQTSFGDFYNQTAGLQGGAGTAAAAAEPLASHIADGTVVCPSTSAATPLQMVTKYVSGGWVFTRLKRHSYGMADIRANGITFGDIQTKWSITNVPGGSLCPGTAPANYPWMANWTINKAMLLWYAPWFEGDFPDYGDGSPQNPCNDYNLVNDFHTSSTIYPTQLQSAIVQFYGYTGINPLDGNQHTTDIIFSKQMIIVGIDGLEVARTSRASFGYDMVDYPNFFIMDMGIDFTNGDQTFAPILTFYQETETVPPNGACQWSTC